MKTALIAVVDEDGVIGIKGNGVCLSPKQAQQMLAHLRDREVVMGHKTYKEVGPQGQKTYVLSRYAKRIAKVKVIPDLTEIPTGAIIVGSASVLPFAINLVARMVLIKGPKVVATNKEEVVLFPNIPEKFRKVSEDEDTIIYEV